MTRKTIFLAAGVLLTAGAVAAFAHGHRSSRGGDGGMYGMGQGMEDHDGDRGRGGYMQRWRGISAADNDTRTRERFARIDRNSDGVIDAAELEAGFVERMSQRQGQMGPRAERVGESERMLRRFDENRDGKVTRQEFDATVRKRFAEMDLNNDARITDDDLPPMMRGRNALAESGGMGRRGGSTMGFIRGADSNRDGVVSLEEAQTQAWKMFSQFDRTKDNVIDKADFDALAKEMVDYRVKRFIHRYGGDKDGKVTREQFDKVAKERFAEMDFNNDGRLTRDETSGRGRWSGHRHGGDDGGEKRRGRGSMMAPDGGQSGAGAPGPGMGGPGTGPGGPGRN